jgi:hypothetical protein
MRDRKEWEKKGQIESDQEHRTSNTVSEPLVRHHYYVVHFEVGLN